MTAVDLVQRQLDAYNARDLERFVATYSDTIRVFRMPSAEPFISGKAPLAELYGTRVFNHPALRAEIVNRIAFGNKVVDHERVSGLREQPFEAVAVYEVVSDLIQNVWFFAPEQSTLPVR